jgi:hypothetical protein
MQVKLSAQQLNPAPWGWPEYALNMTYSPKSRPNFAGDTQHDFRDYQYQVWQPTVASIVGLACQKYLIAARMLGRLDDPIADCLAADDLFDAQSFWVFYAHLAAFWRKTVLPKRLQWDVIRFNVYTGYPKNRDFPCPSYAGLQDSFQNYALAFVDAWALHRPEYIQQICSIVAREHSVTGYLQEIDLFDMLRRDFPL